MIDRAPVGDEHSLRQTLEQAKGTVALLIQRGESKIFIALDLLP